jgi:cell filamentation protein
VTKDGRYNVSGLVEAQYEPGSGDRVLKNLLGIVSSDEMDNIEVYALEQALIMLISEYSETHRFMADDVRKIHKRWLGDIYEWAGEYRQVNVSKDAFPFAMAARLPVLMGAFEKDVLTKHTPCNFKDRADVIRALAETHVELMLIHPFREGNGRAGRLLSTLMGLQAGLPLLDFSSIAEKKQEYFAAIQAGLDRNYSPMEQLFAEIIERSLASN